ncbi:hypothetical protein [Porcipelethomonas sp.]|uniref:hypothetical protein n=1 Tax=Porcipelethomonas sp. TaxID=2981675 RepID=UPI003EF81E9A
MERKIYILLLILSSLTLVHVVIRKIKRHRAKKSVDSDESVCQTADEDKKVARHKSSFGICVFYLIFWVLGLNLLFVSYKNIKYAREITEQGNKTIAEITDVHEYEVSDGDGNHHNERDVYVTYMADGRKYDAIIKEANIYDSAGEQIEIYYSSEDPTVIMSPENVKNEVSFKIPMGAILVIIPFLLLIRYSLM